MKKIISVLLLSLFITSCNSYEISNNSYDSSKNIVIMYSNIIPKNEQIDVFFDKVNKEKEIILKDTLNVTIVDTGNNTYINQMNTVGYDYACFGLNDFSNGLDDIYNKTKDAKFKYLLCSASYNGKVKDVFKNTAPYEIVNYDGIKVGYIGVLSPRYIETNPEYFMEDGNTVINLYNETEEVFYDTVQCSIDKAKSKGADYIVLLSNFDDDPAYSPYTLQDLIPNLSDVNLVINGNEYTGRNEFILSDIDNKDVLIISNGPLSSHFGIVTISNGIFTNESLDK